MSKNPTRKAIVITALVVVVVFVLFACMVAAFSIAKRILRPPIDITGGTSLVYEIDAQGLSEDEKKDLSQRMITVLRRRIDPRGTLPILWRPLGDMRFEVQVSRAAGSSAPQDIQRMVKGAGILEFRILPTSDDPEVTPEKVADYVELLQTKGPKDASDDEYVWCEVENNDEWNVPASVRAMFSDKWYVLASNKANEAMLYSASKREWKLERAYPTNDQMGRRAIGFVLDDRGGKLFGNVTGNNVDRPLCILLDGIAMSAPRIESRIYRQAVITGSFTRTEVEDIVNKLNAGCLPARLIEQPISIKTIGPAVGPDTPDKRTGIERNLSKD